MTLDREGMYLASARGPHTYIATTPRAVYDVTGAGDVVLRGVRPVRDRRAEFRLGGAACESGRGDRGQPARHGDNLARGPGAGAQPGPESAQRKIVSVEELRPTLERQRSAGRRVVFTNGCFDLLHAGHIEMLSFARAQGDSLVVGLNSDRSVRLIKGDSRPIYPAAERALILAALEVVDYVVVFDETRAERIVRAVGPTCW